MGGRWIVFACQMTTWIFLSARLHVIWILIFFFLPLDISEHFEVNLFWILFIICVCFVLISVIFLDCYPRDFCRSRSHAHWPWKWRWCSNTLCIPNLMFHRFKLWASPLLKIFSVVSGVANRLVRFVFTVILGLNHDEFRGRILLEGRYHSSFSWNWC